jgi:hypothetical protein
LKKQKDHALVRLVRKHGLAFCQFQGYFDFFKSSKLVVQAMKLLCKAWQNVA